MIPTSFDYKKPSSVSEAISLLGEDIRILAGGHSLLPALKLRLDQPTALVDISKLSELRYIKEEGDHIAIGACSTHGDIAKSALVKTYCPLFSEGAETIGDVQVRNKGTIGGSLAHADPAADWPALVLAAGAQIHCQGAKGTRIIDSDKFFTGFYSTALEEAEIITKITIPKTTDSTKSTYVKFVQPASRFAIVGCAVVADMSGRRCDNIRVAMTGVSECAYLETVVAESLKGKDLTEENIVDACSKICEHNEILSDHFASQEYRQHLAKVFAGRALSAL